MKSTVNLRGSFGSCLALACAVLDSSCVSVVCLLSRTRFFSSVEILETLPFVFSFVSCTRRHAASHSIFWCLLDRFTVVRRKKKHLKRGVGVVTVRSEREKTENAVELEGRNSQESQLPCMTANQSMVTAVLPLLVSSQLLMDTYHIYSCPSRWNEWLL